MACHGLSVSCQDLPVPFRTCQWPGSDLSLACQTLSVACQGLSVACQWPVKHNQWPVRTHQDLSGYVSGVSMTCQRLISGLSGPVCGLSGPVRGMSVACQASEAM